MATKKQVLRHLLEKQSSSSSNDVVILAMRTFAGNLFKKNNVDEFDYRTEMQILSNWLSDSANYRKGRELVGKSVQFSGHRDIDDGLIMGSFALALGNPINIQEKDGEVIVEQFVPNDFASKSGMSMNGIGDWTPLEIEGSFFPGSEDGTIERALKLNRPSRSRQETLECGVGGIKQTALRMKQMTLEYLEDDVFVEDKKKLISWCKNVLRKRGVGDRGEYLGTIAQELANPKVLRYQKDPVMIKNGRLDSHEWLQVPARTLSSGVGDCDDMTLLVGCIAGLLGLGVSYRIAKCDQKSNNYTHVYNIVHYLDGEVDGFAGEQDVVVDLVYMKRLFGEGFGKEPRQYGAFDIRVL